MIIHYNHDKPAQVYVVNSRLPVYRAWYGDGLGNTIAGLFTRMAPKVAPLAKQLSMKAIDVIKDKGISAVGNLAGKAFTAVKDKLASLVKSRRRKQPVMLPSTTAMPASVSSAINAAVQEKLESLAAPVMNSLLTESITDSMTGSSDAQINALSNAISGSGFKRKQRRR